MNDDLIRDQFAKRIDVDAQSEALLRTDIILEFLALGQVFHIVPV